MNTLDDLRRVLEADAGAAPDPDGVAEAATKGAARIRRRRRLTAAAGAAVLVAAVTVAVPLVTDRRHADGPPPASSPAARLPGQVTLGVDPTTGYVITSQEMDSEAQRMYFRRPEAPRYLVGAIAVDPGTTFDASPLRTGERLTVSGHEARYVADYPLGIYLPTSRSKQMRKQLEPSPVIGWRDPDGTWILVYENNKVPSDRAALTAAAEVVRLTPPQDLRLPVTLGHLPADQPLSFVRTNHSSTARLTLGGIAAPPEAMFVVGLTPGTGVMIEAGPSTTYSLPRGTRVADVAGHEARYSPHTIGSALGNGTLGVRVGSCVVTFSAWDEKQVTKEDLREIADAATYAPDCQDPSTWGPTIRR